ncbi:MAG: glycosyltransferase [Opitutaceae bacterium]|nr:glycosyltransferase [Opitutaceae bacterium]
MIWVDTTHTAHSGARTGVQKVVRAIIRELPGAQPLTFDPFARHWRELKSWERRRLAGAGPVSAKRSAKWPWHARLAGWLDRARATRTPLPSGKAVLLPEIFGPDVGTHLATLRQQGQGPIAAVFHDAIALKLPELSPPATVARFPSYLRELAQCDAIAAVSDDSRRALETFWSWAGIDRPPPVTTLPLGVDRPTLPPSPLPTGTPVVLCVGTLEGRKNHVSFLSACQMLWSQGLKFEVVLIGHAHQVTGATALRKVAELSTTYPLRYYGSVSDADLERAYNASSFTVYPSLMEGFGLPVLESVIRGRPCICGLGGALRETASGGGCLGVTEPTVNGFASAMATLIQQRPLLEKLAHEATHRQFRTWQEYSVELECWLLKLATKAL